MLQPPPTIDVQVHPQDHKCIDMCWFRSVIVNSQSVDVVAAFVVYFHTQSIFNNCCSVFVLSCELTCAGTLSMQRKLGSERKLFPRSGRSAQPHDPKRASKSGGCGGGEAGGVTYTIHFTQRQVIPAHRPPAMSPEYRWSPGQITAAS